MAKSTLYDPTGVMTGTVLSGSVTLTTAPSPPPPEPPPPPQTLPYGDVPALQAMGLLPEYTLAQPLTGADLSIDWGHTTGDRSEIGLIPEDHAAFIAGQTSLLPDILQVALAPPPANISHEHKPNLFWLPYLMTGDPQYVYNMEETWLQFKDWRNMPYDSAFNWYDMGRFLAWSLRDLAQLAYLQSLGVTQYTYYIPALEASRLYFEGRMQESLYQMWNVLGFDHSDGTSFGWCSWWESFMGQSLAHVVRLGHTSWQSIAEFQFQNLVKRSGAEWPFKAVGADHHYFVQFAGGVTGDPELQAWAADKTWLDIDPYAPSAMPTYDTYPDSELIPLNAQSNGYNLSYYQRDQYAYGAAALASTIGVVGAQAKAQEIFDGIINRGDPWDTKNSVDVGLVASPPPPPPTGSWAGWDTAPLNQFVEVTGFNPAASIVAQTSVSYRGTITSGMSAWSNMAHDLGNGCSYLYCFGGHSDLSLNAVTKHDWENMTVSVVGAPSDPFDSVYPWNTTYWNSYNYTLYPDSSGIDVLPDGKPTSRHTYGGVVVDTLRNKILQARSSCWSYDLATNAHTRQVWLDTTGSAITPEIYHNLFYDAVTDKVFGRMKRNPYDYNTFIAMDDPSLPTFRTVSKPVSVNQSSMCVYNRTLYLLSCPSGVTEYWGEFNLDTETWDSGVTSGGPSYDWNNEMRGMCYIPEWGKILIQNVGPTSIQGTWSLYDPITKTHTPYTPPGLNPFERKIGNKLFYYPARNAIIYATATKVYVMKVA